MSEKVTSIIFLAIVGLVLVGMVVGITIAIVKRLGRGQVYKSAAAKYGWNYAGKAPQQLAALDRLLSATLYVIQPGKHELSQLITGQSEGIDFQIVRYHHATTNPIAGRKKAGDYALLVVPHEGVSAAPEGDFWFMKRLEGKLAAVAEKLMGSSLSVPADPEWSWSLVSSSEMLIAADSGSGAGSAFKNITVPGDAIFVFPNAVVFGSQRDFSRDFAAQVATRLSIIRKYLMR